MFFVATIENTADLVLWHEHLLAGSETMPYTHEARWVERWGPFAVLCEVLLEKVRREFGDVLEEAQELAEERRARGQVAFPPLD